jgi:hypothetical protein
MIVWKVWYNVNGQEVGRIESKKGGLGPVEILTHYTPDGRKCGWSERDLGYAHWANCHYKKAPQVPFLVEDVVAGKFNHLLTFPC